MNRKLVVSIIAIILAVMMILSVVLAALPSNIFASSAIGSLCTYFENTVTAAFTLAA